MSTWLALVMRREEGAAAMRAACFLDGHRDSRVYGGQETDQLRG
jgi:hypothetical protein